MENPYNRRCMHCIYVEHTQENGSFKFVDYISPHHHVYMKIRRTVLECLTLNFCAITWFVTQGGAIDTSFDKHWSLKLYWSNRQEGPRNDNFEECVISVSSVNIVSSLCGGVTSISDGIFRFEIRPGPQLQSTALFLGPNLTLWGKYDTMWVGPWNKPLMTDTMQD